MQSLARGAKNKITYYDKKQKLFKLNILSHKFSYNKCKIPEPRLKCKYHPLILPLLFRLKIGLVENPSSFVKCAENGSDIPWGGASSQVKKILF